MGPVIMPVIGSDLARVNGVSHSSLVKLIVLSFIINSRIEPISKELAIHIHPSNKHKVDMNEIENFLNGF
jgi:hypothetical protein